MEKKFVEAIEEGQIVRVTEQYAKQEGLIILKKPGIEFNNPSQTAARPSYFQEEEPQRVAVSDFGRKKPSWKEQQVISELLDNFNWVIRTERRRKGYTRKQFARMINEPEANLQIIEMGRLPTNDFILINKIQKTLSINLRKDQKDFDISVPEIMEKAQDTQLKKIKQKAIEENKQILGEGIEILEDEI